MTHEEFEAAANYWRVKDAAGKKMDREALLAAVETYISGHNTCALATGFGTFVRCTPIEYSWHDGAFWMFSEGGMKFFALEQNRSVCLAIYDAYHGFGSLGGMQVSGEAKLVEPYCAEYVAAAAAKKIPLEALKKLPAPMHLIKVTPRHIDFLSSEFQKQGLDSRQSVEFSCGL